MSFTCLNHFISVLEANGELIRIKEFVDPELEITEITDRFSKEKGGGKALLFENTGTPFPVLMNAFGSDKRMALALGRNNLEEIRDEIENLFKDATSPKNSLWEKLKMLPLLAEVASWMPKTVKGHGKCQEVIQYNPDVEKLPVLKCWPHDGGRFITLPMVHTRDPHTGQRNVGMYRMQLFGADLNGMHWHQHKTGARHYREYKALGQKMPVTVVLGGDPAYTYASTAPMPDNMDEYLLAGFLRKKKVELVKCITNDLEVPADADFVIEGYVDPSEELIWEGPFGDHTGFYSLADWYPKFHITCITHRKDATYPATIVGIPPMEDKYIGRATERIFAGPMKLVMVPEMNDMDLPPQGVAHNITIASINKSYPGQARKVMNLFWGAGQMMFNKIMVVANQDANVHNYKEIACLISQNVDVAKDIYFSEGPLDVLDHSASGFAYGSKLGIDATNLRLHDSVENTIDEDEILQIEGVESVNVELIKEGIRCLIVALKDGSRENFEAMVAQFTALEAIRGVKFILFVDEGLDVSDVDAVVWYVSGNLDPKRDCLIVDGLPERIAQLFVDGTRKNRTKDQFDRDWPNVVTSSLETIKKVDERWSEYGLGKFIPSPSHQYLPLVPNDGAVLEE